MLWIYHDRNALFALGFNVPPSPKQHRLNLTWVKFLEILGRQHVSGGYTGN